MQSSALQSVTDQESIRVRQRNGVPRIAQVLLQLERSQACQTVTCEHLDESWSTTGDVNITTWHVQTLRLTFHLRPEKRAITKQNSKRTVSILFLRFSSWSRMAVRLIVGEKCTLAASHAAPGKSRWVCRQDMQTDWRHTVTLCFPLWMRST